MQILSRFFLPCALLLVVLVAGCDTTDESGIATFSGRVVSASSGNPIESATVRVENTGESTTTNSQGEFTLDVEVDSSRSAVDLTVFASGYQEATRTVTAFVDQVTPISDISLTRLGTGGGGGGDGGGGDGGGPDDGAEEGSGPAASITLLQRSSEAIGVQSAGADETATLTFVVLDAFGNPVDAENAITVDFEIASGPGGGEFLEPAQAETNNAGRVQTTISSGTVAGTVQILASAMTPDGDLIQSFPVVITITGGLPDLDHFSVAPATRNFPGYDVFGLTNEVTAFVGDRYGNPVQPGTAVYFTTNAGIIAGSGTTDNLGRTTVELVSALPLSSGTPPAACPESNANGYGNITARTSNEQQQTIETNTMVLFSGESRIDTLSISADTSGLGNYRFRVSDRFGHPLSPGTTIQVIADGVNVEAVGDINVELGDHLCPGPGRTEFVASVVQGDEENQDNIPLPPVLETVTITVRSINGNIQLTLTRVNDGQRVIQEIVRF